jgi:hypothetical protein
MTSNWGSGRDGERERERGGESDGGYCGCARLYSPDFLDFLDYDMPPQVLKADRILLLSLSHPKSKIKGPLS